MNFLPLQILGRWASCSRMPSKKLIFPYQLKVALPNNIESIKSTKTIAYAYDKKQSG